MDIVKEEQSPQQPFFAEVEELARTHRLGTLQKSYGTRDENRRLLINALVWISGSSLGMIFVLALVLRLVLPGPNAGVSNFLTAAVLAIIGFIILFGCFRQGLLNLRAYQYRNREQVHIYTDGLVYLEGQSASLALRWEQISEVTRGDIEDEAGGKVILDRLYLTLQDDPDEAIFFQPTLPERMEICAQVEQAYTNARLPALLARYHTGETLAFDNLLVSQSGVSIPRALGSEERIEFSWSHLAASGGALEVDQPYTTLRERPGEEEILFKEFTCEIENACLLKALLAQSE